MGFTRWRRRKKREARTRALHKESVELADRAGVDAAAALQCCKMLAIQRERRADAVTSWRQVLVSGHIPACGNAVAERGWRRRGGNVRRERMTADHSSEA